MQELIEELRTKRNEDKTKEFTKTETNVINAVLFALEQKITEDYLPIEKQSIIDAYNDGVDDGIQHTKDDEPKFAEQYYSTKYKQ